MGKTIKFGGTSLGTSELDKKAVKYILSAYSTNDTTIAVVSGQGKSKNRPEKEKLTDYAYKILLGDEQSAREFFDIIERNVTEHGYNLDIVDDILKESLVIIHKKDFTRENAAKIIGLPERVKARIIKNLIEDSGHETVLLDYDKNGMIGKNYGPNIDVDISHRTTLTEIELIARGNGLKNKIIVVPGFIGTKEGTDEMVTLERGMSDGTATYYGSALESEIIEIWSDQNGISRVDPEIIPVTESIRRLTYREAEAFAGLGAGIISYVSIKPARERRIPIKVLNTFNENDEGTLIDHDGGLDEEKVGVRAIAYVDGYLVATVSEMPMNKPGIAAEVLGTFAKHGLSIDGMKDGDSCMTYAFRPNARLSDLLTELDNMGHPVDTRTRMTRISLIGEKMLYSRDNGKRIDRIASDTLDEKGIPIELRVSEGSSVIKTFYIPTTFKETAIRALYRTLGFN